MPSKKNTVDLIYIEGPGDIVESLTRWSKKEDVISETSKTFSGQLFDFCKKNNLNTLAISAYNHKKQVLIEGFRACSKPRISLNGSMGYHLSQLLYGLKIVAIGIRYRPKYLHITNGNTYWFVLSPLKLFGIKLFPHLHNTFWAKGYHPTGIIQHLLVQLDAWFLKHIATGVFCCSPEVEHQIAEITSNNSCPIYLFKPQFNRNSFSPAPLPKLHEIKPFTVVFAGRTERDKGVFDILDMAMLLGENQVNFHICGDGSALAELRKKCSENNLDGKVTIHGKLNRQALIDVYTMAHVVIIPTRSNFAEGFAMVAAEAILLNRPIITSSIVPALEVLRAAAVEAKPEDINSYADAIRQLMMDKSLFEQKQHACQSLREQFLDNSNGLSSMLQLSLSS
jgi:glycogen(starch) synthase